MLTFSVFFVEGEFGIRTEEFHVALEVKPRGFIFHLYFKNKRAVIIFSRQLEHQRLHRFRKRGYRKDRREASLLQTGRSSI